MRVSMRRAWLNFAAGTTRSCAAGLAEVVQAAEVGDPDAQQMVLPPRSPLVPVKWNSSSSVPAPSSKFLFQL